MLIYTRNRFKESEFVVNYILDKISLCNCVTCKNKSQLLIKHRKC